MPKLFYVWHQSRVGPQKLELTIVRAKSTADAIEKFYDASGKNYSNDLITLQVKACDRAYID